MLDQVKKTVRDSFIYSIGNAANKLVGFILLPLYTSSFSLALYGLIALLDTISDLLVTFSSFGIIEGFNRWYWDKESEGKQKSLFFSVFIFSLITTLIFSILAYILLRKYSFEIFGVLITNRTILLFLGSVITNVLLSRILVLLRLQQKAAQNLIFNVLRLVFVLGSTIFFIVVLDWGMDSVFISRLIGQSIVLIVLFPIFIKNCEFKLEFGIIKSMLGYSLPLALSGSMGLIFAISDRWLLKGMTNLDVVGNYSLAYRISNIIKIIIVRSFVHAYFYGYCKQMFNENNYRFFRKTATYFSFLLVMVGMAIIVFAKEIIMLLAQNSDYYDSYNMLPFLIMSVAFSGLVQILVFPLQKYKKSKIISLTVILSGILNIGLNLLLIPIWGGIGAALATAIAQFSIVVTYLILNKYFGDYKYEIGKIILLFGLGAIFSILAMQLGSIPLEIRIPIKIVMIGIFPFVLRLFGFYEDIELLRIKQSWQKWRNPKHWIENIKKFNFR